MALFTINNKKYAWPVLGWQYKWFFIEILLEAEALYDYIGDLKLYSDRVNGEGEGIVLATMEIKGDHYVNIPLHHFNAYCFAPSPRHKKINIQNSKKHWQGHYLGPEQKCAYYSTLPNESMRSNNRTICYEIKLTLLDIYEKLKEENAHTHEFYFEPVPVYGQRSYSSKLPGITRQRLGLDKENEI